MLFDSFEAYDVQETRRVSKEEGKLYQLIEVIVKMLKKDWTPEKIAELLEGDEEMIRRICHEAEKIAPDYDVETILEKMKES